MNQNNVAKNSIGGQAVLEGVMMRGPNVYTVAVRKESGEIVTDTQPASSIIDRVKLFRLPIIRGIAAFAESFVVGLQTLTYSAEMFGDEEYDEEPSKFEEWITKTFGDKADKIIINVTMAISFVLAIGIFMVLPMWLSRFIKGVLPNSLVQNLVEGIVRIGLFLGYMTLISKMKDIERTFEYHGAEHKTINCFDQGKELTIENVRECSRLHKSCGTSFLFVIMIVSILVFSVFTTQILWQRTVIRIVMVPVIAGISYEFIRWARRSEESKMADLFSKPGMWLQKKFTTREPDDLQIEVAIAAVKGVLGYGMDKEEPKPESVTNIASAN